MTAPRGTGMVSGKAIGKIVRSESHVRYTCQVYGPGEQADTPEPPDYAFGSFVRLPLRAGPAPADAARLAAAGFAPRRPADALVPASTGLYAIGLIYDTLLVNPAFGTLGPRLSSDEQLSVFSPDYLSERAVLVSLLVLGAVVGDTREPRRVTHGVPPLAPDLGAVVEAIAESDVRAFHVFADQDGARPYLHMGYLPHALAQDHPLLPMAMLRTIERLETLVPENGSLLSIVKRNLAWRLKVLAAG